MPVQRLTGDQIRRAQELIVCIRGVHSCRISTDEEGGIAEIHVVAATHKAPKLIARDVETCLKAEMGLDVDHRKIGVAIMDQTTAPSPSPEPEPSRPTLGNTSPFPKDGESVLELPVEEYASRFAFQSVSLHLSHNTTRAEVELSRDFDTAFGSAQTDRPNSSPYDVIADATLQAFSEYLDENTRLCLRRVQRVTLDDTIVWVVMVDLHVGRDRKGLVGASLVSGDENQTVVFATLDAVNRVLGKLDLKSSVEYKIK